MDVVSIRNAVVDLLVDAYEDAGMQGLCGEGRWESAVGAARGLAPASIVQRATEHSVTTSSSREDLMPGDWKPAGYNQVSPYLIVEDAAATIDFLTAAFDAERLRHYAAEDGRVMHAEVRIGDSVVMIADGNEAWPPVAANVHIYLPDVDEVYRRALEAGAVSVQEPERRDDEDRRGGVRDAGGTTWWIATREG